METTGVNGRGPDGAGVGEAGARGTHGLSRAQGRLQGTSPALGAGPGKLCPGGIPRPRAGEKLLSARQTPQQQIAAKVRGIRAGTGAAAATELPSAETARRRRRRPKLTRSSRQRPPRPRPRGPGTARFRYLPPGGAGLGAEIWKGRKARAGGQDAGVVALCPPPFPYGLRCDPRSRGWSCRLPSRGHCSAPPRGGGPRGELGHRLSPQALGYPLS